jgi:hypothetical protein
MLELSETVARGMHDSLESVDRLLESLPESKIREFASSEYFGPYRRTFEKWVEACEPRDRDGRSSESFALDSGELQESIRLLVHLRTMIRELPPAARRSAERTREQISWIVSELELIGIAGGMEIDVTESLEE